jgi:hypothetical protein
MKTYDSTNKAMMIMGTEHAPLPADGNKKKATMRLRHYDEGYDDGNRA